MKTADQVIAWAKGLVGSKHDGLDSHWEEIAHFFRPSQLGFNGERSDGANREEDVYDSTPIDQADKMSRNLFAWIMNPATRWFTIEWDDDELADSDEAKEWLESSVEDLTRELNDSNWSNKALQVIHDLVSFGTAMPQVDEKPSLYDEDDGKFRGLLFKAHHMSVSFGQEGADDFVHDTAVKYRYTAAQAVELYGEDNLPDKVIKAYEGGKQTKFCFVHLIVRRRLDRRPDNDTLLPANKRPYWSLHFELETRQVVKEDGYYELTRSMPRYSTTNDSVYGYSPAMKALPDARVLNEAQQKDLDGWGVALEPPLKVIPDKLIDGKVNRGPKGITLVDDADAVTEMPGKPDYQAHTIEVGDKRAAIRQIFLSDELDIPDRERVGQMTAYEIQKRVERILRSAGSVVTSIHTEFLQVMLYASFNLCLRRNVFKPLPKIVAEKQGQNVLKVTLLGPLAKAQRSEDADIVRMFVSDVISVAKQMPPPAGEELLDNVDMDKALRKTADSQGIPQDILRDTDEVEIRRERRREQQAQALAAGAGNAGGPGVPGVPAQPGSQAGGAV